MKEIFLSTFGTVLLAVLAGCGTQSFIPGIDDEGSLEQVDPAALEGELSSNPCPLVLVSDPCVGETYEGRCVGKILIWCEDKKFRTANCKRACGWDYANCFYNCL